jgi:hypothetical protein
MLRMNNARFVGIILSVAGVIIAGIGSLWNSYWNVDFSRYLSGPYAYTVGIVGVVILCIGIYFLTYERKK